MSIAFGLFLTFLASEILVWSAFGIYKLFDIIRKNHIKKQCNNE